MRRRHVPTTAALRDAHGNAIGMRSTPGARAEQPLATTRKSIKGRDRRALVFCDQGHVLAIVRQDGLTISNSHGYELLTPRGWMGLLVVGEELRPIPGATRARLRLVCVAADCQRRVFEVQASHVPATRTAVPVPVKAVRVSL